MITTDFIEISKKNRELSKNICQKFHQNSIRYSEKIKNSELSEKILSQTDSVLTKFLCAGVNLEFLWQLDYIKKNENETQNHTFEWENNISFTDYIFMENFIMQAKSFLEFSMKLTFLVFNITKKVQNRTHFHNTLLNLNSSKSIQINNLFTRIYEEDNWGYKLNKIRNKISHNEVNKTFSEYKPKIDNKEYQRYCQDVENDMFILLQEMQHILFDVKWVSG